MRTLCPCHRPPRRIISLDCPTPENDFLLGHRHHVEQSTAPPTNYWNRERLFTQCPEVRGITAEMVWMKVRNGR